MRREVGCHACWHGGLECWLRSRWPTGWPVRSGQCGQRTRPTKIPRCQSRHDAHGERPAVTSREIVRPTRGQAPIAKPRPRTPQDEQSLSRSWFYRLQSRADGRTPGRSGSGWINIGDHRPLARQPAQRCLRCGGLVHLQACLVIAADQVVPGFGRRAVWRTINCPGTTAVPNGAEGSASSSGKISSTRCTIVVAS